MTPDWPLQLLHLPAFQDFLDLFTALLLVLRVLGHVEQHPREPAGCCVMTCRQMRSSNGGFLKIVEMLSSYNGCPLSSPGFAPYLHPQTWRCPPQLGCPHLSVPSHLHPEIGSRQCSAHFIPPSACYGHLQIKKCPPPPSLKPSCRGKNSRQMEVCNLPKKAGKRESQRWGEEGSLCFLSSS